MATAIAAIRPQLAQTTITSRRLTCAGVQYSFSDNHTATFRQGEFHSCTCGYYHYNISCAHRRLGQTQEAAYAIEAQKREEFVAACSIY